MSRRRICASVLGLVLVTLSIEGCVRKESSDFGSVVLAKSGWTVRAKGGADDRCVQLAPLGMAFEGGWHCLRSDTDDVRGWAATSPESTVVFGVFRGAVESVRVVRPTTVEAASVGGTFLAVAPPWDAPVEIEGRDRGGREVISITLPNASLTLPPGLPAPRT